MLWPVCYPLGMLNLPSLVCLVLKFRCGLYNYLYLYCVFFQPEKAIAEYESAMKKNPQDHALANKIGQALVKTHQFNKVNLNCFLCPASGIAACWSECFINS